MAELDWSFLNDVLGAASVDRGVTAGITPPSGGGSFVFGLNSLAVVDGAVALKASPTAGGNFDPLLKGGSIRAAVKRGASPGPTGWAPFLFIGLQASPGSVNDQAYLLGLEDNEPYRIVLRKTTLVTGVPEATEANSLRRSNDSFLSADDKWHHLRLDMVVNLNGDVVLKCFANDLDTNPIGGSYVWSSISGMGDFIDDALGINSGSQPFTDGRLGFGSRFEDSNRRAFFDQIECLKQV